MIVGIPQETKRDEYRVSMLPVGVEELVRAGHRVLVQLGAGAGSGLHDDAYRACGGQMIDSAAEVFAEADLIVKVKEPQPSELGLIRPGQTLFTYFHFAADRQLTDGARIPERREAPPQHALCRQQRRRTPRSKPPPAADTGAPSVR